MTETNRAHTTPPAAPGALSGAHPDADLIADCLTLDTASRHLDAEIENETDYAEAADAVSALTARVTATYATTPAGMSAKARVALLIGRADDSLRSAAGPGARLAISTLRDMALAEFGEPVTVPDDASRNMSTTHPDLLRHIGEKDRRLIKKCTRFMELRETINAQAVDCEEDSPLWNEFNQLERDIIGAKAFSVPALAAKAAAMRGEIYPVIGSLDVGNWAASIIADIRRLGRLAAAASTTQPGPHPDAELIAACLDFEACVLSFNAIYDHDDEMDEADAAAKAAPIRVHMDALLDRMDGLKAATSDGIAARARVLAVYNGHGDYSMDVDPRSNAGRLMIGLLRDVLLMNGLRLPAALATLDGGVA